jgi:hypothetical protein
VRGPLPGYWDPETQRQCMEHVRRLDPATFGVPLKSRSRVHKAGPARRALVRAAGR